MALQIDAEQHMDFAKQGEHLLANRPASSQTPKLFIHTYVEVCQLNAVITFDY